MNSMNQMMIEVDGQPTKVFYQKIGRSLWLHVNGETHCFEDSVRKGRGRGSQAAGQPGEVRSPMPGKIIKVLAEKGQAVEVGDSVLVLEAMKMEYTLKSNLKGLVTEIKFEVGDQVKAGELLVRIEDGAGDRPEENGEAS